ncbi:MAG TPA: enoyl-CoA hydratase [Metalysinibacillus jejuensis]|uniref:Enoyl-CoA hydratase n=1 Tax=Metalysinibacillus jejuensis TaxID=914327 RepID=A0A921NBT5_9BACL|nr:enoyl-CoA hydratase [Metalysinibacillus jejuensis]HJH11026.1 enoyl-CoA hydratase [Metalysinibacillus jejuensis]
MKTYETIELTLFERSATLTLNRPMVMNAMNATMMKELSDCFATLKKEPAIQVLLIKGAGKAFSAGGDIKAMLNTEEAFDMEEMMRYLKVMVEAYYTLPMITVAAVQGAAAGLGFSLALGADIIFADEESKLAMNFIGIGLVPDGGGHFFMTERLGAMKAKQLIWQGEIMEAKKAQELGLVDYLAPKGDVLAMADQMIGQLLASPILSMIETKKIIHAQKLPMLQDVLTREAAAQSRMRKTADHLEGIQAFVEKRQPKFEGK